MAADEKMSSTIDRIGGSLVNAILGALILWVGQTTFRHAGVLASVDEKFAGIKEQFADVDRRQDDLKTWVEKVATQMKDSDRSQFTMKEGDKLIAQVRQAEQITSELERRMGERLAALDIKLTALDAQQQGSGEVNTLKMEVAQLRAELTRAAVAQEVQFQSGERFARGSGPVFLPPVDSRR
jgi:hypothetical protein